MAKKAKQTSLNIPTSTPDADRRLRQADRLARILRVLQLLQGRGRWDAKSLSEEIECSERTIYRDLAALELAGVPWFFDKEQQCYRVRPDYVFPVLNLTDAELIGQSTATAATKAQGLNINAGAKPTTEKIAASNAEAERLLAEASRITQVLDLKIANHSGHLDCIRTVQWALLKQRKLTGTYDSPYEAKPVKLTLSPYKLALVKSAWYVIGLIDGNDTPRTLRIVRFKSMRMTDSPTTIPAEFSLTEYFGHAWAVYRGDTIYDIELQFDKSVAAIVAETVWHHTQKVKKHQSGEVTLSFSIAGLNEIVRWVLGWAGAIKIVKPTELRELVLKHHRQAIEANE